MFDNSVDSVARVQLCPSVPDIRQPKESDELLAVTNLRLLLTMTGNTDTTTDIRNQIGLLKLFPKQ